MNKAKVLYDSLSNQSPKNLVRLCQFMPSQLGKLSDSAFLCTLLSAFGRNDEKQQQSLWSKCEPHWVVNCRLNGAQCNKHQHSLFARLSPNLSLHNPPSFLPHIYPVGSQSDGIQHEWMWQVAIET